MFVSEAREAFVKPGADLYATVEKGFRITKADTGAPPINPAATGFAVAGDGSAASLAGAFPISYYTQLAAKGATPLHA